jgi:hypothetical protein
MTVLTFLPRFAPLVKACTKLRTIRGLRKRPIKAGDRLSLRMWSARPYNSPQIILRESVCIRVTPVEIDHHRVITGSDSLHIVTDDNDFGRSNLNQFAVLDGFASWFEMVSYFDGKRGLPFSGVLIEWDA